jgi:hypothetical protein
LARKEEPAITFNMGKKPVIMVKPGVRITRSMRLTPPVHKTSNTHNTHNAHNARNIDKSHNNRDKKTMRKTYRRPNRRYGLRPLPAAIKAT